MKKKTLVTRISIIAVAALFVYAYAIQPLVMKHRAEKVPSTEELERMKPTGPAFNADSAYAFCQQQCSYGPRTMNSVSHDECGQWIAGKFRGYGLTVDEQRANLTGYDGTTLHSNNIIAAYQPENSRRILLCAHWDSRPWADNDPDEANWKKPVMAANDGASGVAVMLEIARLLANTQPSPNIGIDFVCFDAEDWGTPQWSDHEDRADSWALGAQYWAEQYAVSATTEPRPRYGILLDMVGGRASRFYQELYSKAYAPSIVRRIWKAADVIGMGSYFPKHDGGMITDDHVPVNTVAHIPTVDIIPYFADCPQSSFGPTWHTVSDNIDNIDRDVLRAVGQTLIQVIYTEE